MPYGDHDERFEYYDRTFGQWNNRYDYQTERLIRSNIDQKERHEAQLEQQARQNRANRAEQNFIFGLGMTPKNEVDAFLNNDVQTHLEIFDQHKLEEHFPREELHRALVTYFRFHTSGYFTRNICLQPTEEMLRKIRQDDHELFMRYIRSTTWNLKCTPQESVYFWIVRHLTILPDIPLETPENDVDNAIRNATHSLSYLIKPPGSLTDDERTLFNTEVEAWVTLNREAIEIFAELFDDVSPHRALIELCTGRFTPNRPYWFEDKVASYDILSSGKLDVSFFTDLLTRFRERDRLYEDGRQLALREQRDGVPYAKTMPDVQIVLRGYQDQWTQFYREQEGPRWHVGTNFVFRMQQKKPPHRADDFDPPYLNPENDEQWAYFHKWQLGKDFAKKLQEAGHTKSPYPYERYGNHGARQGYVAQWEYFYNERKLQRLESDVLAKVFARGKELAIREQELGYTSPQTDANRFIVPEKYAGYSAQWKFFNQVNDCRSVIARFGTNNRPTSAESLREPERIPTPNSFGIDNSAKPSR